MVSGILQWKYLLVTNGGLETFSMILSFIIVDASYAHMFIVLKTSLANSLHSENLFTICHFTSFIELDLKGYSFFLNIPDFACYF